MIKERISFSHHLVRRLLKEKKDKGTVSKEQQSTAAILTKSLEEAYRNPGEEACGVRVWQSATTGIGRKEVYMRCTYGIVEPTLENNFTILSMTASVHSAENSEVLSHLTIDFTPDTKHPEDIFVTSHITSQEAARGLGLGFGLLSQKESLIGHGLRQGRQYNPELALDNRRILSIILDMSEPLGWASFAAKQLHHTLTDSETKEYQKIVHDPSFLS